MLMSIVAMLCADNLYADVYLYVYPFEASKKARVELTLPVQSPVEISVFDDDGQLIYSEMIKKGSSYRKVYDFSNVKTGIYRIISNSDYLKMTKTLKVNENSIEVLSTEFLHRPIFTLKDDLLTVQYMNLTRSNVELSIENSERIFYKANLPSDVIFKKRFDVHKLYPGEYNVLFETNGNRFSHCLIIN